MALIYKITNSINQKVYIGKTIRKFSERKSEHLRDYKKKDNKLYRAMRKYGIEYFQFEILEDNILDSEISKKEQEYIKKYNSYYCGYNSTFGGEGESSVDQEEILNLYKAGFNCSEIAQKTGHTIKTISSIIKRNGFQIINHTGLRKDGLNGTEVKVSYLGKEYISLTKLAEFLQQNEEDFLNKDKKTIIQGISKALKNNSTYYGRKFYRI